MKKIFILIQGLTLLSCGFKNESKSVPVQFHAKQTAFIKYVNQFKTPEKPKIESHRFISSNEYPMKISLYNDGKFYYQIPTLGDGFGTWTYGKSIIKLFAERLYFDMNFSLRAADLNADDVKLEFRDRDGWHLLKMFKNNMKLPSRL